MCDALAVRNLIWTATIWALFFPQCKASVDVSAKTAGSASLTSSSDEQPPTTPTASSSLQAPRQPGSRATRTQFFGIARGLTLAPSKTVPICSCVTAAVGSGTDPGFDWHGQAVEVGPDGLVVAIGADAPCDHQGRGPSIQGIERRGQDVVVVLEEWKPPRPRVLGAVVPNPGPDHVVSLRAAGKSAYGRPLDRAQPGAAQGLCRVGAGVAYDGYLSTPEGTPGSPDAQGRPQAYDQVAEPPAAPPAAGK